MANGFSAGDLTLSIGTTANETLKVLDAIIERLSLIQNGLGTMSGFARGRSPYIKKSTSGSRTEKTYSVGKHGKEYLTLSKDIQRAEKSLKTITTQFDRQGKVLKKTTVDVDEYGNKITKIFGGGKDNKKGGIFGFLHRGASLYMMRRLGHFMGDLVQAGSDYNETLNLWQVAMRNNLDVADQFVNKMQKAYGISTKTLMNAQAIFKNMIGSLGQISDATAYALSEALVHMSADFASLYNVKIEQAFEKMQSMLAGQVRPIRSAGLDMTETTLFMFYQQLGGTKTMRQLNRTEKQLLSILAVYKQMGSAGALGDMSKTLNQFANQSRMLTEYWAELKTWSGLLLKDLIDDWGLLVKINALLITATEVVKAIAKSRGLGEENFLTGMFETAEATNDEVDELQGKLLDFDKFRSLEGAASASPLAIDEKLLQALTGYSSKIDQAKNDAKMLSDDWLIALGATEGANGELVFTEERLEKIQKKLKSIIGLLVAIPTLIFAAKTGNLIFAGIISFLSYAYTTSEDFRDSFNKLFVSLSNILLPFLDIVVDVATPILNLVVAIITPIAKLVSLISEIGMLEPLIYGIAAAFLYWKLVTQDGAGTLKAFANSINAIKIGIGVLAMGVLMFIHAWDDMGGVQKAIGILAALAGAIAAAAIAMKVFKMDWAGALGVAAVVAGGALAITSAIKIPNYENGASDIDSGTVFRAGEFGKTEAVFTGSNGKTNVANVKQMEQAFYNALSRHARDGSGTIVVQTYLDGEKVYENTTAKAKAKGNIWAKV